MSEVLSPIDYICFRKTSGSNMGAPNLCYRHVCLKQLIFVQKTNLLKRPPIWDSQIKDKRS